MYICVNGSEWVKNFRLRGNYLYTNYLTQLVFFFWFLASFEESQQQIITLFPLSSASSSVIPTKCTHLFHHIQKSPLWSSPVPPPWQLHLHHLSANVFTIPPLYVPKPFPSSHSDFSYKVLIIPKENFSMFNYTTLNSASCLSLLQSLFSHFTLLHSLFHLFSTLLIAVNS